MLITYMCLHKMEPKQSPLFVNLLGTGVGKWIRSGRVRVRVEFKRVEISSPKSNPFIKRVEKPQPEPYPFIKRVDPCNPFKIN